MFEFFFIFYIKKNNKFFDEPSSFRSIDNTTQHNKHKIDCCCRTTPPSFDLVAF